MAFLEYLVLTHLNHCFAANTLTITKSAIWVLLKPSIIHPCSWFPYIQHAHFIPQRPRFHWPSRIDSMYYLQIFNQTLSRATCNNSRKCTFMLCNHLTLTRIRTKINPSWSWIATQSHKEGEREINHPSLWRSNRSSIPEDGCVKWKCIEKDLESLFG